MKMEAHEEILSRGLPKTSQSVVYVAGDDGTYESGWWKGKLNLGNKVRYIARTIGGDDVVIDRATGLMWGGNGYEAGCGSGNTFNFADAIAYAESLDFAGFDDWRLPNINELLSIVHWSTKTPAIAGYYFVSCISGYYRCSTTYATITTKQWIINFADGIVNTADAVDTWYLRCVRLGL